MVEGAGGLAVPIRRDLLQIDVFAQWKSPVILCASTRLGTINHSLLSIEALKRRAIPILGVAFMGDANPDSEATASLRRQHLTPKGARPITHRNVDLFLLIRPRGLWALPALQP